MPLFRAGQRHLVGAVGEQVEHVARRAEERNRGRPRHLVDALRQKQSLLRLTQGTKDGNGPTDLCCVNKSNGIWDSTSSVTNVPNPFVPIKTTTNPYFSVQR